MIILYAIGGFVIGVFIGLIFGLAPMLASFGLDHHREADEAERIRQSHLGAGCHSPSKMKELFRW